MSPIFYYMKEDRYHLVGYDYSQAIKENPDSRIWVLCLPGIPMCQEIKDAIKDYQIQERVDAFNMWSLLYRKNP
jgi:capsule polysaccharide export protein KpsC/LpsZ